MGALTGIRLYAALGAAAIAAGVLAWAFRLDALRAGWKGKYEVLTEQASEVLLATRRASGHPKLSWDNAATQIDLIAAAGAEWKSTADQQTVKVDELGRETARLKALNAEERRKAEAIIARRDNAIARLSNMAIDPGDRADCVVQLREAEAALDLVFREGL